jgi:hypothetical protein
MRRAGLERWYSLTPRAGCGTVQVANGVKSAELLGAMMAVLNLIRGLISSEVICSVLNDGKCLGKQLARRAKDWSCCERMCDCGNVMQCNNENFHKSCCEAFSAFRIGTFICKSSFLERRRDFCQFADMCW